MVVLKENRRNIMIILSRFTDYIKNYEFKILPKTYSDGKETWINSCMRQLSSLDVKL